MDLGRNKETAHSRRSKETNLADIGSVEGAVEAWGGGGGIESPPSPSQQFLIIIGIFDYICILSVDHQTYL